MHAYVTYAFELSFISMREMSPCHDSMVWSVWKHFLTHLPTHWIKENQKEIKNLAKFTYGHFWPLYQDTHFEPLQIMFSKLNLSIFLHILKEHIKVSNFHVGHLV